MDELTNNNGDKRDALGRFMAGRVGGRPKGAKGKFTTVKEMVVTVLEDLGGPDWMFAFASSHPKEFIKLIDKLLPESLEVSGPDGKPVTLDLRNQLLDKLKACGQEPKSELK